MFLLWICSIYSVSSSASFTLALSPSSNWIRVTAFAEDDHRVMFITSQYAYPSTWWYWSHKIVHARRNTFIYNPDNILLLSVISSQRNSSLYEVKDDLDRPLVKVVCGKNFERNIYSPFSDELLVRVYNCGKNYGSMHMSCSGEFVCDDKTLSIEDVALLVEATMSC